jgi:hypothetical protein
MLAYVMTRTVNSAIKSVNVQLKRHGTALFMRAPFELLASSIVPNRPQVKQTVHQPSDGRFDIIHAFLKFSEN